MYVVGVDATGYPVGGVGIGSNIVFLGYFVIVEVGGLVSFVIHNLHGDMQFDVVLG